MKPARLLTQLLLLAAAVGAAHTAHAQLLGGRGAGSLSGAVGRTAGSVGGSLDGRAVVDRPATGALTDRVREDAAKADDPARDAGEQSKDRIDATRERSGAVAATGRDRAATAAGVAQDRAAIAGRNARDRFDHPPQTPSPSGAVAGDAALNGAFDRPRTAVHDSADPAGRGPASATAQAGTSARASNRNGGSANAGAQADGSARAGNRGAVEASGSANAQGGTAARSNPASASADSDSSGNGPRR